MRSTSLYARRLNRPHSLLLPRSTVDNPSILATAETAIHPRRVVQHNIHSFFLLPIHFHTLSLSCLPNERTPIIYRIISLVDTVILAQIPTYLSEVVSTSVLAIACYLALILGAASAFSYTISWTLDARCFLGPFLPPRLAVCLCWRCLVALMLSSTTIRVLHHNSSRYVLYHVEEPGRTWRRSQKSWKEGRVHLEVRR